MNGIVDKYKEYNYPSAEKLYQILNKKYKLTDIKAELKKQNVYQLYYNKPSVLGGHILALAPKQLMQIDLTFMDKFGGSNKGYKYILLAIDVFSRYAWGIPLKTKTVGEITEAFIQIPAPECVISDNGGEFLGKEFQNMLNDTGIAHQTAILNDHHALGIVDRMTLTLKNLIYKNFIANDDTKWYDKIDKIMDTYNNTPHSGIYGYTPNEAFTEKKVQTVLTTINSELMQKGVNKDDIKEGDTVRVRKKEWSFKRGYTPKWSEDVSKVDAVKGNTIMIDGKRHKIVNVQVVNGGENVGKALQKAVKEHKIETALKKEGVAEVNIRPKREREIKFDASLVGRLINRGGGEQGKIEKYEDDGDYKWFVKYDKKSKMKSEWMDAGEIKQFLVR